MNRTEMIKALQQGKKMKHHYFTPKEFLEKGDNGNVKFEDGCQCSLHEFFRTRQSDYWQVGWSEWKGE